MHRANDGYSGGDYTSYVADPNIDYGMHASVVCKVHPHKFTDQNTTGTIHYYSTSFAIPPWNATFWGQWYIADRTAIARSYVLLDYVHLICTCSTSFTCIIDYTTGMASLLCLRR